MQDRTWQNMALAFDFTIIMIIVFNNSKIVCLLHPPKRRSFPYLYHVSNIIKHAILKMSNQYTLHFGRAAEGSSYDFTTNVVADVDCGLCDSKDSDSVSNHQPHECLLNSLFRHRSKKTSKLRVTGLCAGNSLGTGEFPAQMASYAENVSIWWRHHALIGMVLRCIL